MVAPRQESNLALLVAGRSSETTGAATKTVMSATIMVSTLEYPLSRAWHLVIGLFILTVAESLCFNIIVELCGELWLRSLSQG